MKILRKLLSGTILVALTAFGLTALTSSSTNSADNTQVWAFLNKTCSGDIAVLLENIEDMLKLRGQERHGIVLDFESYYRVAELHQERPQCYQVSALLNEPPVSTTRPKPKIIPADPPPSGGGGGGGGGGGETQPKKEEPGFEFNDKDLKELNSCWQEKVEDLFEAVEKEENKRRKEKLQKLTKQLEDYVPNAGAADGYKWFTSKRQSVGFGRISWPPNPKVTIYSKSLTRHNFAKPEHIAAQAVLQEYFHIIQRNRLGRNPKPYEVYDIEVEAHNMSTQWFLPIFGFGAPVSAFLTSESNLSSKKTFKDKTQEYKDLEVKKANGTLTKEEEKTMKALERWFQGNLPKTDRVGGLYNINDDLGCEKEEEEE